MKQWMKKVGARGVFLILPAAALALVLLLNILAVLVTDRFGLAVDLTQSKLFGLSAETIDYLQALTPPVKLEVLAKEKTFVDTSVYNAQANEIIRQIAQAGQQITLSYIDYVKDPTFAARYPELAIKPGDLLVSSGERYRLVKTEELFHYAVASGNQLVIASSKAEETLLAAILNVTSKEKTKAALLEGHAEYTMPALEALLANNNYETTRVSLLAGALDPQVKLLLLLAPKSDLSLEELQKLDAFLVNDGQYGKTIFYCADAQQPALPNLEAFLREWGVAVEDGAVFETDEDRVYNYHPFYPVVDYADEEYAGLLRTTAAPLLMPLAKPLTVVFDYRDSYAAKTLLQFGESTGVRPSDAPETFTADSAARRGPIPALVRAQVTQQDGGISRSSQIFVSASAGMLDGYALENPSLANAAYLLSLFSRSAGRTEPVQVRSKSIAGKSLNITQAQADRIGMVFVVVLPLAILAGGAAVWLRRRNQ